MHEADYGNNMEPGDSIWFWIIFCLMFAGTVMVMASYFGK